MKIEEAYSIKVKQLIDSAQYALSELLKYGLVDDIPELKLNKKNIEKTYDVLRDLHKKIV